MNALNCPRFFILTGDPGVGKTTLVKKLTSFMTGKGVRAIGFYTEEVRKNNVREGFDVVSLQDGARGRLARDQILLNGPVKSKVGKYGVLIQEFESVALPTLNKPEGSQPHLLVIDEIGKMEFFSETFKNKIRDIFNSTSYIVLATIPIRKSDTLIESIRNNKQAKVWTITKENRNSIQEEILTQMKKIFGVV